MNFKQLMIEKLKANVAYKVADDSTLIREVAERVLDDLDYNDIANELIIDSSDIAEEIDTHDIISGIIEHLDLDDIRQAVAEKCDMTQLTEKVIDMLPSGFMDDIAVQAAEEIMYHLQK